MNLSARNKLLIGTLIILVSVGGFLRLKDLARQDMQTDDATYSFRAIGYFDYIASENKQSTPVTWFAEPQWWQSLSFHDAPPLVFATQWAFFHIGGDSAFMARLPFALTGIASIISMFLLGQAFGDTAVGLVAAGALAIMNYHVWISRIGYLESFLVLWIILALYFFLRARDKENNYFGWAAMLACGMLTKYSFLFLFPVFAVPLFWWRRKAWKRSKFVGALAVFFVLISPILIYNVMMFQTRGHFDAALSTLVGMHPADFVGLTRTAGSVTNAFAALPAIAGTIAENTSLGFLALILLCMIIVAVRDYRDYREKKDLERPYLLWSGLLWAVLALTVMGMSDRFGTIIIPFLALVTGIGVMTAWNGLAGWRRKIFIILVALAAAGELFYTVQTQLMLYPIVTNSFFLSANRPSFQGYAELENYVQDFYARFPDPSYVVFTKTPQIFAYQAKIINDIYDSGVDKPQQTHLLIFDDRMDWFATLWTFEKRRLYDVATIPSIGQFISGVSTGGAQQFAHYGFTDVTIIAGENDAYPATDSFRPIHDFVANLAATQAPVDKITNPYGKTVFNVYTLPLTDAALKPLLAEPAK
ncbi:MAG: glycosyltransferase family 39 protein [Patescibacteria group bacterium]|nr:glycosyltransferase family 39 protein [Patescibacteria group bacterium]